MKMFEPPFPQSFKIKEFDCLFSEQMKIYLSVTTSFFWVIVDILYLNEEHFWGTPLSK